MSGRCQTTLEAYWQGSQMVSIALDTVLNYFGSMYRTGFGYDSHRFAPDRKLILGGVEIPSALGLAGHSDADAVLHAITDAILGAIGQSDIGQHFPDTDPAWKNADSTLFLSKALQLASDKGFAIVNCDVTILAETPKLGTHKEAIKLRIADLLGKCSDDVAVKAKTNETMGFVGRGEGIAVMASVLLAKTD